MMSGRLVKAVAASVVPLALLQGCGEKKPEDTTETRTETGTETGTTTPPATELATDISSLVENEFKTRERKNVEDFFSKVLKDKIKVVEDGDGVVAQVLPTKITLNVLAHHHDGNANDFHAIEDMYTIKELRDIWEYKEKQMEMPAPSITQGFRENFVVNRGDIYLANPLNQADSKASAGIFFKYDGEAPVKGEDGNSRKTFGDSEKREEDKVPLPMVIISRAENASAHNMLYNYGLAVITVRDLGMSTCFKAAFDTFKIVTMVIAEARAREAKNLAYDSENQKNFELYEKGEGVGEKYNPWALYTQNGETPPKGQKEAKTGATCRTIVDGKREEHMKEQFQKLYKNVRSAMTKLSNLKTASATRMMCGNLEQDIVEIDLVNQKEKDIAKYKKYADLADDDALTDALENFQYSGPKPALAVAGGYARMFKNNKALYWKLNAYAHNAVVYSNLRNEAWYKNNVANIADVTVDDDLKAKLKGVDQEEELMKQEPLFMAEDFEKDFPWIANYQLHTADMQNPAFHAVMLDVAMHHDRSLFNLLEDVAEVFEDIYSLSEPESVKNIPRQVLFAPFFCWVGTGLENIEKTQPQSQPANKVWKHSHPLKFPMKQKDTEFFKWDVDSDHPGAKAKVVDEDASYVKPYKSRLPKFLFDIISGKDDTNIEEKFPYFTHKDYVQKQKDLGLGVELVQPNRDHIYTTVPESIYWSAPAKSENIAVAMFLGMTKAFYQEWAESDKSHVFFLGKGSDQLSRNSNDWHKQRKFSSKDKDNKKNIPMEIILSNKKGGADWNKVKEAVAAALTSGEDSA